MTSTKPTVFVVCLTDSQFSAYSAKLRTQEVPPQRVIRLSDPQQLVGHDKPEVHFFGEITNIPQVVDINTVARLRQAVMRRV